MKVITGGVTAAKGFEAASTAAGIKYEGRKDMALIVSRREAPGTGGLYRGNRNAASHGKVKSRYCRYGAGT